MKVLAIVIALVALAAAAAAGFVTFKERVKTEKMRTELEQANARADAMEAKAADLEKQVSELRQELQAGQFLAETNSGRINRLSETLDAALAGGEKDPVTRSLPGAAPAAGEAATAPVVPEVIEALKEEVKKEIKEERLAQETQARQKWFQQMRERESANWKKKLEEEFPKTALALKLSPTQEFSIREVAEDAFKKLMALMEEAMTKPWDQVDWAAYQEKTEKIYKEAEAQVVEMVSEEQAKALRKFFEVPGR